MDNIEELLIANAELAADLLKHMADNEIDSDYFAVVTDSPNCGREVQSEHSITETALMVAGVIEQLIAQLEAAQKERDDLLNQEFQQRLANAEHQLYMKDLAIHNIKASRKAQFIKRLAAEYALSAANEKHGWIKRSDQMPDPSQQRRVCVFTPNSAADLRYRLVPANLFKAVCSSATHWHYVNDPVEGGE